VTRLEMARLVNVGVASWLDEAMLVTRRGRQAWQGSYAIVLHRTGAIVRLRLDLPRLPVR
jgi:hypothetical protein